MHTLKINMLLLLNLNLSMLYWIVQSKFSVFTYFYLKLKYNFLPFMYFWFSKTFVSLLFSSFTLLGRKFLRNSIRIGERWHKKPIQTAMQKVSKVASIGDHITYKCSSTYLCANVQIVSCSWYDAIIFRNSATACEQFSFSTLHKLLKEQRIESKK